MLFSLLFCNLQFACFENKGKLPHLKQYYLISKQGGSHEAPQGDRLELIPRLPFFL